MGLMINTLCRKSFNKIFNNLSKEIGVDVNKIQLGIYFNGKTIYEAYNDFKMVKEIDIDDYCGAIIDMSGGNEIIKSTISQSGVRYAKELNCQKEAINIIMQYNDGKLPNAVLLCENKKVRKIDIETEFLNF